MLLREDKTAMQLSKPWSGKQSWHQMWSEHLDDHLGPTMGTKLAGGKEEDSISQMSVIKEWLNEKDEKEKKKQTK